MRTLRRSRPARLRAYCLCFTASSVEQSRPGLGGVDVTPWRNPLVGAGPTTTDAGPLTGPRCCLTGPLDAQWIQPGRPRSAKLTAPRKDNLVSMVQAKNNVI